MCARVLECQFIQHSVNARVLCADFVVGVIGVTGLASVIGNRKSGRCVCVCVCFVCVCASSAKPLDAQRSPFAHRSSTHTTWKNIMRELLAAVRCRPHLRSWCRRPIGRCPYRIMIVHKKNRVVVLLCSIALAARALVSRVFFLRILLLFS